MKRLFFVILILLLASQSWAAAKFNAMTGATDFIEIVDDATDITVPCSTGEILKKGASDWECAVDSTAAGGQAVILDLADDGTNESTDIGEIAVTNDTGSVFTEPAADKLLIDGTNLLYESELDTESELEAQITDMANIIQATEIDTFAEVDALVADKTLVNTADGATWTGTHDFGGATLEVPNTVVGSLPAATLGRLAIVTDGASDADCTTGGGSTVVSCMANGSTWEPTGDSGSGGGSVAGSDTQVQFNDGGAFGADADLTYNKTTNILSAGGFASTGGSGAVDLDNQGEIQFQEATANGDNYVSFKAPASLAANVNYILPNADSTGTQYLASDGSGNLSWGSPAGSGDVTAVGDCASGDCFTGATGTTLSSNTDLIFDLDEDNNGTESFQIKDGADTTVVEVAESGLITTLVGIDAIGAVDMDYGSADVTDHTFTTDGTGDAEIVLPNNSIGAAEMIDASTTTSGDVELATVAETDTGTDATRAITPDGLAGSNFGERAVQMVIFDYTTDTATGDGKAYFHIDSRLAGMDLVDVHAEVITAGTTGTTDIQIHNVTQVADMLTTKITIDSAETGSDTAATAAVIDTANDDVAENDLLRIDVDAVSTTAAQGLIVTLGFRLP